MEYQKKLVEELLIKLHEVEKNMQHKPRKLKSDTGGILLLDQNNAGDVEWYKNDADYDVIES